MTERRPNVFGLSRDIWNHPLFADERFSEREAWMWLVGAASWKDIRVRGVAGVIDLKRGEFSFSVRFLAEKWGWTKSTVDRFLGRLETDAMIRDTGSKASKVYFINNYNRYQVVGIPKPDDIGTATGQARDTDGTAAGQQRDKEETGETVKQGKQDEERESAADAAPPSKPEVIEAEFVEEEPAKVSHETAQANEAMELPLFLDRRSEPPQPTATVHALPADPLERALFAYHRAAEAAGWSQCKNFHESRKTQMRGRIVDAGGFRGWCEALTKAANSKFLRGDNNRNWKPGGIDWFLNRANFTKIMEGAYDDPAGQAIGGRDSAAEGFTRAAAAYSD